MDSLNHDNHNQAYVIEAFNSTSRYHDDLFNIDKPYFEGITLSNVDAGETAATPVTTVLSLQNLMEANKFLVLFNVM